MDALDNFFATLLPTSKSKRTKSITSFVTALVFAMLVVSMAAPAHAYVVNPPAVAPAAPATLVVTAINAGRFYGDANPSFIGTITGLRSGDTITVVYNTVANPGSAVGDYAIVPTLVDPDGQLGNYVVVINNGTLTVTPAPLTVIADDATRAAGAPNPTFTGTISGVKNGDAITATQDSAATTDSQQGTYPIVPTVTGATSNYSVSISNGTLTVTP